MAYKRSRRVAELIRQIVGETLMFKVKNQQAKKATVHDVEVSDNLRHVKIFVSMAPGEKEATMQALMHITGFVRKQIGAEAGLKFTPDVEFVYDHTLDQAERIEQLLRSLK